MALTSVTTIDIIGGTQTIVFNNPGQIDQIQYSGSGITFSATAGYNLAKSDLLLFGQFITVFYNLLQVNFPSIINNLTSLPNNNFSISQTFAGVTHINFAETSLGNSVFAINYLPSVVSGAIASRSQITITPQEFFLFQILLVQYINQVRLN
jgi:hypothetical protein